MSEEAAPGLTRRQLAGGAGSVGAAMLAASMASAETAKPAPGYDPRFPPAGSRTAADFPTSAITSTLAAWIAGAGDRLLPGEVAEKARWHLLDTFAAMVAGSQLPAGLASRTFIRENRGAPRCSVAGAAIATDPIDAAMANGTMGHGHEVDDTGGSGGPWHPGVNVVPAALALGEASDVSGERMLRAVVLGYDVGGRVGQAAGLLRNFATPTVSVCGYFGAAAAACCVAGLDERRVRWALSYTAQQSSGMDDFRRDPDHIEKGFLNGGMGARGGVTAVRLVEAGFTGVGDPFSGPAGFFSLYRAARQAVDPDLLVAGLGERWDVMAASFKRRPVAGAISAVLDSLEAILARRRIDPATVRSIVVRYEPYSVTDNAGALDVNMQHAVALMLVDGRVTYRSIHDSTRFSDPAVARLRGLVNISPVVVYNQSGRYVDPSTAGAGAAAGAGRPVVRLTLADGTVLEEGDVVVRGARSMPFDREWVVSKARALMVPVLGEAATGELIERTMAIDRESDVRRIGSLLRVRSEGGPPRLSEWPLRAEP